MGTRAPQNGDLRQWTAGVTDRVTKPYAKINVESEIIGASRYR
jgi:hypothetical protein